MGATKRQATMEVTVTVRPSTDSNVIANAPVKSTRNTSEATAYSGVHRLIRAKGMNGTTNGNGNAGDAFALTSF